MRTWAGEDVWDTVNHDWCCAEPRSPPPLCTPADSLKKQLRCILRLLVAHQPLLLGIWLEVLSPQILKNRLFPYSTYLFPTITWDQEDRQVPWYSNIISAGLRDVTHRREEWTPSKDSRIKS
jgi:hypothetical protein